jgi:hypothetical protein
VQDNEPKKKVYGVWPASNWGPSEAPSPTIVTKPADQHLFTTAASLQYLLLKGDRVLIVLDSIVDLDSVAMLHQSDLQYIQWNLQTHILSIG